MEGGRRDYIGDDNALASSSSRRTVGTVPSLTSGNCTPLRPGWGSPVCSSPTISLSFFVHFTALASPDDSPEGRFYILTKKNVRSTLAFAAAYCAYIKTINQSKLYLQLRYKSLTS